MGIIKEKSNLFTSILTKKSLIDQLTDDLWKLLRISKKGGVSKPLLTFEQ